MLSPSRYALPSRAIRVFSGGADAAQPVSWTGVVLLTLCLVLATGCSGSDTGSTGDGTDGASTGDGASGGAGGADVGTGGATGGGDPGGGDPGTGDEPDAGTDADPGGGTDPGDASSGGDPDSGADEDAAGGGGTDIDDAGPANDGGAAGDAGDDTVDTPDEGGGNTDEPAEPAGYPSEDIMLRIASPGGNGHASVSGAKTTVAGVLFGDVDTVSFQASSGETGEIAEGPFWTSGPITLTPGDNTITVTAAKGDKIVSDTVVVTYNPAFRFDDVPLARPPVVWLGASSSVVFTVPVSLFPNFDANTVTLLEVDPAGGELANLGQMVDNGATSSTGDEIQGDGVYTKKVTLSCEGGVGVRWFRASVVVNGATTYTAISEAIPVHCVEHFTTAECQSHAGIIQQAEQQANSGNDVDDVIEALKVNPSVQDAGRSNGDGYSIWVQFTSGVLGAVLLAPPGTRGSGKPYDDPFATSAATTAMVGGNVVELGSKKAIVLAPFAAEFGSSDDGPQVATILATSECPTFSLAGGATLQGGAASLERFRSLNTFGVVSISSHGDALFESLDPADKKALYEWDHPGGHEVLWSGEAVACNQLLQTNKPCTVSSDNPSGGCPAGTVCLVTQGSGGSTSSGLCLDRTQVDLRLGRVVMTNKGYAMTPAFFDAYAGRGFPNTLVNIGACRSLYNGSIASSFFANGAKSITGFSGYVDSDFAKDKVVEMFEGAVGSGQVGVSHTAGEDPANPGTHWRLFGAGNLDLSNAEIINASFETGDTTGWTQDGDGRVVTQLGSSGPVAGKFMGLLSTGLGFTVQTGSLEQDFCIPADKNEVQIYWKFFSEEFKEYCGSQFQDTFQAVLIGAGGQLTLVDTKIDDLCFYTDGSCSGCSNPSACDFECMGGSGCEFDETLQTCSGTYNCQCGKFFVGLTPSDVQFDQGGVFNTFWQKTVKNVTALAGAGKVTMRLFSSDTGDSIFDTVLLIDDIEFK